MKLHFDYKLCQYPKTYFPFALNFLLWKPTILTKVCSGCPFYVHSIIFVAIYLVVNLAVASYRLIQQLLIPADSVEACSPGNEWVLPVHLWKYQVTIRISGHYFQLVRALFSVQAVARSVYNLAIGDYGALLGLVVFVPIFFALDVRNCVRNYRAERFGEDDRKKFVLKQSLSLGSAVVFWSNICCLLYNRYGRCVFEA